MKRIVLISIVAVTFACGGADQAEKSSGVGASTTPAAGAGQPASATPPGTPPGASAAATGQPTQPNQTVTLVGCLQGPGLAGAVGTSGGDRARARAEGSRAPAGAGASSDRYMLVDALAASEGSGGVGTNGAGGSGGPLVSGRSTFELDGIPADARTHVNKQVRITGRVDANPATIGGPLTGAGSAAESGTPSTPASGASHGSMGTAANGPATASGRGRMGAQTAAAAGEVGNRHLMVDSVEVVAQNCSPR